LAFQLKNQPVPSLTAWFVPNSGSCAIAFLCGLSVALLGLAFSLLAIAEAEEKATKSENYHKSDCAKNLK
jgi:hypothetical protein